MRRLWPLTLATLAGCALGPDYHRPAVEVPSSYRDVAPAGSANQGPPLGDSGWWEVYADPQLQTLIRRALASNFDVKIAVARIDEARAALGSARLNYLPQVAAQGSATRTDSSRYVSLPGFPRYYDQATAQLQATYQVDLWGQLRRENEAARANLLASQYAKRAVTVTLISTLANAYFSLISLDSQLEITRRTVATRDKFLELTHAQSEKGYATGLDVANAEAQLALARANVPDLERQIAQTEDEISILLGMNPGPIERARYGEAVPEAPPRPPAGLPAELLERRPDVALAEQGLVAANAQVGVAKAALFPNISLTGTAGSLSIPISKLFTAPAAEWTAGVGLVQPILNAQTNLYQLELADARKREAIYAYQKAVQSAFQDVADALVAYEKYGEFEREQARQVDALRRAREIAVARYRIGYASYFDVINADRDLFTAELQLAQAYTNNLNALVRLYAALGGGWQEMSANRPEPATP